MGSHFFLQGDLPNPGIEPGSPALQADSSPSEPPGWPPSNREGSLLSGFGFDCSAHLTYRCILFIPPSKFNPECFLIFLFVKVGRRGGQEKGKWADMWED